MKAPVAVALVAASAALLAGPVQHAEAFRLHATPLQQRSSVGPVRRARGALSAVQSMPPPTATSSSSGAPERPQRPAEWTPETWRQFVPRQMPEYEDKVGAGAG